MEGIDFFLALKFFMLIWNLILSWWIHSSVFSVFSFLECLSLASHLLSLLLLNLNLFLPLLRTKHKDHPEVCAKFISYGAGASD